jgi:hypothetical protein
MIEPGEPMEGCGRCGIITPVASPKHSKDLLANDGFFVALVNFLNTQENYEQEE